MTVEERFTAVTQQLPPQVTLVAVSKTHPVNKIKEVYDLGQRIFGENRVQELIEKQPQLPADIRWHLIGHLQRNKVKYIIEFIDTIESVDSAKLLSEIEKQAEKINRKIKVLLQVKIAEEDSKYGLTVSEAAAIFSDWKNGAFPHVEITGLMGMATFTDDDGQLQQEFGKLKKLYDDLNTDGRLSTLSMGMSGDFKTAIDCGSTSVRIGSAIFGSR